MPVTLFILVLAFGALVAAGVPLLLGFTAVLAALGVTELLSHVLHVDAVDHLGDPAASGWRSGSTTRCSTCAEHARSAPTAARPRRRCRRRPRPPAGRC